MNEPPEDPTQATEQALAGFNDYFTHLIDHGNTQPRDGFAWTSHEQLIQKMTSGPVVVPTLRLPRGVQRGQVRECYYNAYVTAIVHRHLTYTEGYAQAGFFPVQHAWCTDTRTGNIVDPTWINLDYQGPFVYQGLKVDLDFLNTLQARDTEVPTLLVSDYQRRFRALRDGLAVDETGTVTGYV